MNLKHLIVGISASLVSLGGFAESHYLHIQTANGNWEVLSLDRVDRLTFDGGQMIAGDSRGKEVARFDAANLSVLQINESSTEVNEYDGIEESKPAETGFTYDSESHAIRFDGNAKGELCICGADGRLAVSIPGYESGQSVDVSALAVGAYVITLGTNSSKIVVK